MQMRLLLAAVLILAGSPGAYGWPHAADTTNSARLEAARQAETTGDLARAREDFPKAASYYEKAVRNDRNNSELYNKLGIAYLKINNNRSARKNFNHAVKLDPQNTFALNNLGALACMEKKYQPAVQYLKRALALNESIAAAHLNLAEAWLGLNDADRAMTEYARAIELDHDILDSSRSGLIAQVTTPEQRARVDFLIAEAYAKRGNKDGALDYLQRAKDERMPDMKKVYADQEFASLWNDPRLEKIVKR